MSAEEILDSFLGKLLEEHKGEYEGNTLESIKKLPEYKMQIAAIEAYRNQDDRIQKAIEFVENRLKNHESMKHALSDYGKGAYKQLQDIKDFLKSLNPLP